MVLLTLELLIEMDGEMIGTIEARNSSKVLPTPSSMSKRSVNLVNIENF